MKSIYEASVAYGREHQGTVNIEDFEAGANYVLDEIEMLLPKEDKNLNDYGKALVWRIKDTIEQLKGNQ